jgi:tRNA modification GTPase
MDLLQAEAVADLIDGATPLQARAAFDQLEGTLTERIAAVDATLFDLIARLEASVDFPEEGYHFVESGELTGALDALLEQVSSLLADGRRPHLRRSGSGRGLPDGTGNSMIVGSCKARRGCPFQETG